MSVWTVYAGAAACTLAVGLVGAFSAVDLLRRLLAINIAYSGVFLVFVAIARRDPAGSPDAVPQALVLTGIVVSVCATALALSLERRLVRHEAERASHRQRPEESER